MERFEDYYVSGCRTDGDDVEQCPDAEAEFWTVYGLVPHERALKEGRTVALEDFPSREAADQYLSTLK